MFVMNGKAPKSLTAHETENFIHTGRAARIRMRKSDPYQGLSTKQLLVATARDAKIIADRYNEKAKGMTDAQRMELYKDTLNIQLGYDPIPRVGDFFEGHTVTDVVNTENKVEIYGVLGTLPKKEIKKIIEDASKIDCLRDKMKRRGYRFIVLELI